jgi:invasion protein IalB
LSGQAFAQQPAPAPAPAQQRKPAAQPAAPAATPAPAAPAAQSNRVELIATQPEWTKVCGKDEAANKEICYTTRDFGQAADQAPVLAVAIYDVKGDEQRIVRLLLPVGLMLRPGFRFSVDKGAAIEGNYEICFPNGCFAEARVKGATLDTMKKGSMLNVNVKNQVNNEVIFVVPLSGFGKAFDGAAIDPKVLEEQQKALQAELQKRAEEERRRLEGAGAAPAAPAAPR